MQNLGRWVGRCWTAPPAPTGSRTRRPSGSLPWPGVVTRPPTSPPRTACWCHGSSIAASCCPPANPARRTESAWSAWATSAGHRWPRPCCGPNWPRPGWTARSSWTVRARAIGTSATRWIPSPGALASRGHDGSAHRARQIEPSWLTRRDLILAMDAAPRGPAPHGRYGRGPDPAVQRGGRPDRDQGHPRSLGGGPDAFGRVLDLLRAAAPVIVAWLARLLETVPARMTPVNLSAARRIARQTGLAIREDASSAPSTATSI